MKSLTAAERAVLLKCGSDELGGYAIDSWSTLTDLRVSGRITLQQNPPYLDIRITDFGRLALRCCPIEGE